MGVRAGFGGRRNCAVLWSMWFLDKRKSMRVLVSVAMAEVGLWVSGWYVFPSYKWSVWIWFMYLLVSMIVIPPPLSERLMVIWLLLMIDDSALVSSWVKLG